MHKRRAVLGDLDIEDGDTNSSMSNGELLSTAKHKLSTSQAKYKSLSRFEEDSVRLIGQHLRGLGLK